MVLFVSQIRCDGPVTLITNLLQNNVAGHPDVHVHTKWEFDPEVSKKRRNQFYEVHGFRAEKLIERLGLGIDGHDEERRAEQRQRDAGRLNGVIYNRAYYNTNLLN